MTKTTGRRPMNEGVAFLIESDLERAELVLSAKSITDMLQKMAEQLARIEANELMPLLDPMRTAFGPQIADGFNRVVTEKARGLIEQVKQAKEAIGIEISRLEGSMNGESPNDMQIEPTPSAEEPPAPAPAPDSGQDNAMGGDMGGDMGDEAPGGDAGGDTDGDELGGDKDSDPFASLFSDEGDGGGNAAGRDKKESFKPLKRPMSEASGRYPNASSQRQMHPVIEVAGKPLPASPLLAESADPDAVVLKRFRRLLGEGISPATAARRTADAFAIDITDVVEIVKEAAARRTKLDEKGKVPPQFLKHQKGKKSKKDGIDDDGDGTPDWEDKKPGKKDGEGKKPDADKDGVPNWADKHPHKKGSEKSERKDTKESKEAGKSARPFAGSDRSTTVSENITPQRKAELQQMGYAVNVTGKGFQWVRPKTGSSTNDEQGQRPNRNEDDAWRELDGHVKKQADQLVSKLNTPAGRSNMPAPGQPMREAQSKPQTFLRRTRG